MKPEEPMYPAEQNVLTALIAAVLIPVGCEAIQVTRPYGEPSLRDQWQLAIWMRQTQPQSESTSQGRGNSPQVALLFQRRFGKAGELRAFWGGTVIDAEYLFESDNITGGSKTDSETWLFGLGGYYSPNFLPDERFETGHRLDDESMKISRYGFRAILLERGANYETTLFYSWGREKYDDTGRTAFSFVLPKNTTINQYGISYVWDDRKRNRRSGGKLQYKPQGNGNNAGGPQFIPTEGTSGSILATWTRRKSWKSWGSGGTQFDDSNQAKHWRAAMNMVSTTPAKNGQMFSLHLRGATGKNLDRLSAFGIGGGSEYDRNPYRFRLHGYFFNEFLASEFYGYNIDFNKSLGGPWVFYFAYDHVFAKIFDGARFVDSSEQLRGTGTGVQYYGLYGGVLKATWGFGMDAKRDGDRKNNEFIIAYERSF